ncbi:MAG: hypothetical protein EBX40_01255 [Gammaproteobacteria bacterium]|nr:hypothetical protein [Gammaproteobacteria bacterium]
MLIFEDDVVLRPRFTEKLEAILKAADELPPGWLIYLGGRDTRVPDAFFLNRNLLFPLPMATADGYLTDAAAISKRLEWLSAHKALFGADHLLHRVDPACHIQNYWPKEALVEQGSVLVFSILS